jgi:hypothetical protein
MADAGIGSSIIRTVVPAAVGILVGWAAKAGFNLPNDAVSAIVTIVITGVYYAGARWIEAHFNPTFGRILLSLGLTDKAPVYHDATKA